MLKQLLCAAALLSSHFAYGAAESGEVFLGLGETAFINSNDSPVVSKVVEINEIKSWKHVGTPLFAGHVNVDSIHMGTKEEDLLISNLVYAPGKKLTVEGRNIVIRGCIFAESIELIAAESIVIYQSKALSLDTLGYMLSTFRANEIDNLPTGALLTRQLTITAGKDYIKLGGIVTGGLNLHASSFYNVEMGYIKE